MRVAKNLGMFPGLADRYNIRSHSNFEIYVNTPLPQTVESSFRTFMCVVCGFIYNEAEGWPDDGIAPGTRWDDVPETWTCPDCGVTKSDFEMVAVS